MSCCGGIEPRETDFKKLPFDDIYLNINKSKLKFFTNEKGGIFKLVNNQEGGVQTNSDLNRVAENLEKEIKKKDNRIEELKHKISEIEKKLMQLIKFLRLISVRKNISPNQAKE